MNIYHSIATALEHNDHNKINVVLDQLSDYWRNIIPSIYELTATRIAVSHIYDVLLENNRSDLAMKMLNFQIDKSGRSACTGFCEMISSCVKADNMAALDQTLGRIHFSDISNSLKGLINKSLVEHMVPLSLLTHSDQTRALVCDKILKVFEPESLENILNVFLQEINQKPQIQHWKWMKNIWDVYAPQLPNNMCEDMLSARIIPSMVKNLEESSNAAQEEFLKTCLRFVSWDSLVKSGNYAGVGGYETWYFTLKRHDHATWDPYSNEDQPRLLHYLSIINYLTDQHSQVHGVFPNLAAFKGLQRIVQSPQGKSHAPLLAAICERSVMSEQLDVSRCSLCDGVCVNPKHKSKRKM